MELKNETELCGHFMKMAGSRLTKIPTLQGKPRGKSIEENFDITDDTCTKKG